METLQTWGHKTFYRLPDYVPTKVRIQLNFPCYNSAQRTENTPSWRSGTNFTQNLLKNSLTSSWKKNIEIWMTFKCMKKTLFNIRTVNFNLIMMRDENVRIPIPSIWDIFRMWRQLAVQTSNIKMSKFKREQLLMDIHDLISKFWRKF